MTVSACARLPPVRVCLQCPRGRRAGGGGAPPGSVLSPGCAYVRAGGVIHRGAGSSRVLCRPIDRRSSEGGGSATDSIS